MYICAAACFCICRQNECMKCKIKVCACSDEITQKKTPAEDTGNRSCKNDDQRQGIRNKGKMNKNQNSGFRERNDEHCVKKKALHLNELMILNGKL